MKFKCLRCGTCCTKFQPYLSLAEARKLSARLGIDLAHFLAQYADSRWPGTESILIRHLAGACAFLQRAAAGEPAGCSIHEFKPDCCRAWQAGPHQAECREAIVTFGLP